MAKKISPPPSSTVGKTKTANKFIIKEVDGKLVKSPVKIHKVRIGIILSEKMYLRLKRQSAVRKEPMAAIVARALENELSALEKEKN